jgi:hypothetical protein
MAWYKITSSLNNNTIAIEQCLAACAGFADIKMASGATEFSCVPLCIIYR